MPRVPTSSEPVATNQTSFSVSSRSAGHARAATRARKLKAKLGSYSGAGVRARIGKHLESQRQQCIACEDRGRLIERLVHGWPAAPQVVVVHGGQIVMDQGVTMHAFQRAGCIQGLLRSDAEQRRALDHQEGPEPLATAERPIAHRFEKPRGNRAESLFRQPMVEMAFNAACMGFQAFCKGHGETTFSYWPSPGNMDHMTSMLKRVLRAAS
jgi:hypothetical protein